MLDAARNDMRVNGLTLMDAEYRAKQRRKSRKDPGLQTQPEFNARIMIKHHIHGGEILIKIMLIFYCNPNTG